MEWRLRRDAVSYVGEHLHRPECIIAQPDGMLWIADKEAVAVRRDPDGRQTPVGKIDGLTNGMALDRAGRLYIADIERGRVLRMSPDGTTETVLADMAGTPLGAVNFVLLDSRERLWITVSTRAEPRSRAIDRPRADGYVALLDEHGARIVLDDLWFTNEVRLDAREEWLYVAETTAGRVSRAPVRADGSVGAREVYGPDGLWDGAKVDGITFDADHNLWVTEITRNALVVITPKGEAHTVFEDPAGEVIDFPTSVTFGGPDLRTAYVGSLRMTRLPCFTAPVPGLPLHHWHRA